MGAQHIIRLDQRSYYPFASISSPSLETPCPLSSPAPEPHPQGGAEKVRERREMGLRKVMCLNCFSTCVDQADVYEDNEPSFGHRETDPEKILNPHKFGTWICDAFWHLDLLCGWSLRSELEVHIHDRVSPSQRRGSEVQTRR